MRVWLKKKYAEKLDGVDLRRYTPGDAVDLKPSEARLLVAEGWAYPDRRRTSSHQDSRHYVSANAEAKLPSGVAADRRKT
jgi:hypothetical protein